MTYIKRVFLIYIVLEYSLFCYYNVKKAYSSCFYFGLVHL